MDNNAKFSKIFHQISKNFFAGRKIKVVRREDQPEEWKTTYYKSYPRLPKIDLDDNPPSADFFDVIKKRQSRRDFTRGYITKRDLSLILKYSCGEIGPLGDGRHRRAQPSGGARFPIEVYPILFRSGEDLSAGLYHYNVKYHKLDVLWDREFGDKVINDIFIYPWVKDVALGLVMASVFWRNQNKYGERGYRQILLEAGHIGQNVYLVSEALGLKCCALAGTRDENLEKLIDIDGITDSGVYTLVIGK